MNNNQPGQVRKRKSLSYAKWGYLFIAPFFITYTVCSLLPLLYTFYNSFFENFRDGLKQVGPNFVGLQNYATLFTPNSAGGIDILTYTGNTMIMWIMGAIPQLIVALLLAVWLTSYRLNIKKQAFFKTVFYMPNLIMASAFSMLFFTLFSNVGPINQMLMQLGFVNKAFDFFGKTLSVRVLIATMNFLMWFGNTTIVLMAGIMGIDGTLFEAAQIDGASSGNVFFRITLPLLKPILVYVIITALIGGVQMFDVPQILTNRLGTPNRTAMTLMMYLNSYITPSRNFGMGGAISVIMFLFTGILSLIVYRILIAQYDDDKKLGKKKKSQKSGRKTEVSV